MVSNIVKSLRKNGIYILSIAVLVSSETNLFHLTDNNFYVKLINENGD